MRQAFILVVSVVFFSTAQTVTTVDQIVYDHVGAPFRTSGGFTAPWGAHEGLLHGVPSSYDWAAGARPGYWMNHGDNGAITSWGQVYEWANESPETNIRIQLRNHKFYVYVNGTWNMVESASDNIKVSKWKEDFNGNMSATARVEPASNGGGVSIEMSPGYNIHWWDPRWPRAALPSGYQAFFATCEARIIPNTNASVNLNNAKYLGGVSADSYPTTTSSGSGPWPSLSITRHKYLKPEWQTLTSYISGSKPTTVEEYRNQILSRPLPPGVTGSSSAPAITQQPQNVRVAPGGSAVFSVAAQGTAPLSYLWMRNGATMSGHTASTLTIQNVALTDNGTRFSVKITNSVGSVISAEATLTVAIWDGGALYAKDFPYANSCYTLEESTEALHIPFTNAGTSCMTGMPFPGVSGTCQIKLTVIAETDGQSQYKVFVKGVQAGSTYTAPLTAATMTVIIAPSVQIGKGDTVAVWSQNDLDAWGRWTAIEFVPLTTDALAPAFRGAVRNSLTVFGSTVTLHLDADESADIMTGSGRIMRTLSASSAETNALKATLPAGAYVVTLRNRNATITRRVVVGR